MNPPFDVPKEASALEVLSTAELPPARPSLILEEISSESEQQLRPRKRNRTKEQAVAPSSSLRPRSPTPEIQEGPSIEPSPLAEPVSSAGPIHSERSTSPRDLNTDTPVPDVTSGPHVPLWASPPRASPPRSILRQIIEAEEAKLKNTSLVGVCDLMNTTTTRVITLFLYLTPFSNIDNYVILC